MQFGRYIRREVLAWAYLITAFSQNHPLTTAAVVLAITGAIFDFPCMSTHIHLQIYCLLVDLLIDFTSG